MYLKSHNCGSGKTKQKAPLRKQKGVALITALIITSVAVSIAALIIDRQQIQIRLSSNISTLEQNYQYAYGMEDFAGTILKRSWEDHPEYDSLNDSWYSETGLILPITGGLMTGKLYDLHARINLNSLIRPKTEKKAVTDENLPTNAEVATDATDPETPTEPVITNQTDTEKEYNDIAKITQDRLNRLIFNIDELQEMGPAENFAVNVRDWIDNDEENGKSLSSSEENIGNGAETPYYQSLEPSYYSANTEMISPTELRLIKDMQEKFYTAISTEISVLPTSADDKVSNTAVNVNTASENVLKALGFAPDAITNILEERAEEPFVDISSFEKVSLVSDALISENNPNALVDPLDIGFKSEYFLLEGKVEINNTRLFVNSVLWRNQNGAISVIMRDFSNPQSINKALN